jgi:hypothetical protein
MLPRAFGIQKPLARLGQVELMESTTPHAPQTEELPHQALGIAPTEGKRLSVEKQSAESHLGALSLCEIVAVGVGLAPAVGIAGCLHPLSLSAASDKPRFQT